MKTNGTTHQPSTDGQSRAPKPATPPPESPKPGSAPAPAAAKTEAKAEEHHDPKHGHKHKKPSWFVVGLFVLGAVVLFLIVLIPRLHKRSEVRDATDRMAVPNVTILHPKPGPAQTDLTLPGDVRAFQEAPIFARTNGYLKKWYADIGTPVKEGQLLAEIETPEVDQQLNQARAARDQASANLALAKTSADRWNDLLRQKAVAQQEADQKNGDYAARQADYAAADADVKRLESLQSFQKITAPFDGVVTRRSTDVGALINSTGSGQELFRVAQLGTLRVYVNVPEAYSASVPVGTPATIDFASFPGQPGQGKIVSTAGAIDPQARTLLVEIQVPNPEGRFLSGGYARVHFQVKLDKPALIVPSNALLFRAPGSQVGIVKQDQTVELRKVQIGRDYGTSVEIVDGLQESDSVILNPSDSLTSGTKVQAKEKADPQDAKK